LAGLATVLLTGCTDAEQVFVEALAWENPPTGAQGFLGYSDVENRVPICGNCHVGMYAEWKETNHSHAWADLQGSGHAQEYCEGCHTVGANGNWVVDEDVGWTATGDPRFYDVQCESCHGPGLEHVSNPDASQPLAYIDVGPGLTNGCGECHTGTHTPFVEEWAESAHGKRDTYPQNRGGSCAACHELRGVFAAWGVDADYVEKDTEDPMPLVCATCHDPHDGSNARQLRFPVDVADTERNLCMKCHQRRATPDESSRRGPHSPQGPLLLGEAGWWPPNMRYDPGDIVATHGTEANPDLCAGCHVTAREVVDEATGDFVFHSTGHLFKATPCLDEQGVPTPSDDCAVEERSFSACSVSGCHGNEASARSALIAARSWVDFLVEELNDLLDEVPADEFDTSDGVYSPAEGAAFNALLAMEPGSPVHNPFLVESLLLASIELVRDEYGLAPDRVTSFTPRFTRHP
jgi:predicted CXXCH cytochrome family protein